MSSKRRVCILSMQRVNNFGSILQSYALKKILNELGHEVSFIDIERIDEDAALRTAMNDFRNELSERVGVAAQIEKLNRYAFRRLVNKRKLKRQWHRFDEFRNNILQIDSRDNDQYYDYCVIGSDEVFNCLDNAWWEFTSQLFGNVRQAHQVLTYAASCGATRLEKVPDAVRNRISESMGRLSAISVRDQNSYEFVYALTGRAPEISLDPVAIGDFDEEMKSASNVDLPEKYCILYAYGNRFHDMEDVNKIKRFCDKHGLFLIEVGAPQFWARNFVECDPFTMLNLFKNASMVITDTFHGTIFSAKYSQKFAVMIRESNRNKLSDLVVRLNIQEHLINSIDDLEETYRIIKDQDRIDSILQNERIRSIQYLRDAIQ